MLGSAEFTAPTADGMVMAFDLGGTYLRAAFALGSGPPKATVREPSDRMDPVGQIARLVHRHAAHHGSPEYVVVGVAGVVLQGRVYDAPNLPALRQEGALRALREALPCPVAFENDANLAALGEGEDDLAFVAIGTGLGCGLVRDGAIMGGSHGRAGELGLLPYPSPVGATLEDLLSGPGIERLHAHHGGSGDAFAALQDDSAAGRLTREALVGALTFLLQVITLSFDPQCIRVGGGVGLRCASLLDDAWRRGQISELDIPRPRLTDHGDQAVLQGGLRLAATLARQTKEHSRE